MRSQLARHAFRFGGSQAGSLCYGERSQAGSLCYEFTNYGVESRIRGCLSGPRSGEPAADDLRRPARQREQQEGSQAGSLCHGERSQAGSLCYGHRRESEAGRLPVVAALVVVAWIVGWALAIMLALISIAGCTSATGGSAAKQSSGVQVRGAGFEINISEASASTTQPSASGLGKLKLGAAEAGELGSMTLAAASRNWRAGAAVAAVFLAAAVGFYLLRRMLGVALCLAGAVVGFFWPVAAALGAAAAIAWLIFDHTTAAKQIVAGVNRAIAESPLGGDAIKASMTLEQDTATARYVAALRGKA